MRWLAAALLCSVAPCYGAVSILGTPQSLSGGSTYTAEAGTNRVVACAFGREGTSASNPIVSTIVWGSASMAGGQIVMNSQRGTNGNQSRTGVFYVLEANIPVGAQTLTMTWGSTMAGANDFFTCYTLGGVDQTTPIDANDSLDVAPAADPWGDSIAVVAGSVQILAATVHTNNTSTPVSPWTEVRDTGDTDYRAVSHSNVQASGTTLAYGLDFSVGQAGSVYVRSFAPAGGAAPVTLTSVNTTNSIVYTDVNRPTVWSGAGATQGASTFKLVDQGGTVKATQSIDSWSATAGQFDVVQGNVRHGLITYELIVGGDTATLPGTLTVPSGEWYVTIANLATLDFNLAGTAAGRVRGQPNRYYDAPTDIANGDQLHCKRTGGTGVLYATWNAQTLSGTEGINADGSFIPQSTVTQIQCRFWDDTTDTWGTFQTWDLTGTPGEYTGPDP